MAGHWRAVLMVFVSAACAVRATPIFYDFGNAANVPVAWISASDGAASSNSIVLDGGALSVTGTGLLTCDRALGAGPCVAETGSAGGDYSQGLTIGLVDLGEDVTFTVGPNYIVSLVSLSVVNFGSRTQAQYSIDGAEGNVIGGRDGFMNVFTINSAAFNTLAFSVPGGGFSVAEITFDITETPEPATFGLVGIVLIGVASLRFRKRPKPNETSVRG